MHFKCPASTLLTTIRVLALLILVSAFSCQRFPTIEPSVVQPSPSPDTTITAVDTPSLSPSSTSTKTARPTTTATPTIPAYSVDPSRSRVIAVIATDEKQNVPRLYLFKFGETQLIRPYEDQATDGPLSWSPDGKYLLADSVTEEEAVWPFVLYRTDVSTMHVDKLIPPYESLVSSPTGYRISVPSWSWNIPQIAFSQGYDRIHLMSLDGVVQFLTEGYYPVWLDGSTAIAFLRLEMDESRGRYLNFGDMFRFDLDTKQVKQLTEDMSVHGLASSPDGKWIAFNDLLRTGSINLMKSDGSELALEVVKNAGAFSWDPDGSHLFIARDCMIYRVRIDGTMIEKVDLPKEYCYWYAVLQPIQ